MSLKESPDLRNKKPLNRGSTHNAQWGMQGFFGAAGSSRGYNNWHAHHLITLQIFVHHQKCGALKFFFQGKSSFLLRFWHQKTLARWNKLIIDLGIRLS